MGLRERLGWELSAATLSKHLAAGYTEGILDREWEGNARYGKYVYWRCEGGES